MEKNALILGGGIAGLSAALQLADLGYPVSVVTDESHIGGKFVSDFSSDSEDACIWDKSLSISALHLGGNLHASPAVLTSFILRVTNHPNIRLYKQTKLISIQGTVGNFVAGIGDVTTGQQIGEVHAGTIILATGFGMFDPVLQPEFGYGRYGGAMPKRKETSQGDLVVIAHGKSWIYGAARVGYQRSSAYGRCNLQR